jgi:hypothetical protein
MRLGIPFLGDRVRIPTQPLNKTSVYLVDCRQRVVFSWCRASPTATSGPRRTSRRNSFSGVVTPDIKVHRAIAYISDIRASVLLKKEIEE